MLKSHARMIGIKWANSMKFKVGDYVKVTGVLKSKPSYIQVTLEYMDMIGQVSDIDKDNTFPYIVEFFQIDEYNDEGLAQMQSFHARELSAPTDSEVMLYKLSV